MRPLTYVEHWEALCRIDYDMELERIFSMTPAQVRRSLIERGYDFRELDAHARAAFSQRPLRRVRARFYGIAGVGTFLATVGIVVAEALAPVAATTAPLLPLATAAAPAPEPIDAADAAIEGGVP